ncbi:MAG TPA: YdcF family protein [Gemmatimonadales bacterium]|nr:YdcF family protein [Gemmatimonadales bacterium]
MLKRRRSRTVLRAGVWIALAGTLAYAVSFGLVLLASREDQRRPADAIVVLGAAQYNGRPSPVLRARLDHALELYRAGLAPLVVVTGGIGTGDRESEATVGRRYLVSNGVPPSAVVVRPEGRTTEASMRAVAEWVRDRDLRRVLLVSDPFHMCRLRLEARRVELEAHTSPTRTSPISENPRRELAYLAAEALKVPVAWVRSWW